MSLAWLLSVVVLICLHTVTAAFNNNCAGGYLINTYSYTSGVSLIIQTEGNVQVQGSYLEQSAIDCMGEIGSNTSLLITTNDKGSSSEWQSSIPLSATASLNFVIAASASPSSTGPIEDQIVKLFGMSTTNTGNATRFIFWHLAQDIDPYIEQIGFGLKRQDPVAGGVPITKYGQYVALERIPYIPAQPEACPVPTWFYYLCGINMKTYVKKQLNCAVPEGSVNVIVFYGNKNVGYNAEQFTLF